MVAYRRVGIDVAEAGQEVTFWKNFVQCIEHSVNPEIQMSPLACKNMAYRASLRIINTAETNMKVEIERIMISGRIHL